MTMARASAIKKKVKSEQQSTETDNLTDKAVNWYKYSVGIDLSFTSTGLVVINDDGTEKAFRFKAGTPDEPFSVRVNKLWEGMTSALPKSKDTLIVMEGAAYAAQFKAFQCGELAGAIKMRLADSAYKVDLIAPTVLKKFATGKGNATKDVVAKHVEAKWGFTNRCHDIVDAYVLAMYAHKQKIKKEGNG